MIFSKTLTPTHILAAGLIAAVVGFAGCSSDQTGRGEADQPSRAYPSDDMNNGASKNINDIDLNHNAGDGYNPDRVGPDYKAGGTGNGGMAR